MKKIVTACVLSVFCACASSCEASQGLGCLPSAAGSSSVVINARTVNVYNVCSSPVKRQREQTGCMSPKSVRQEIANEDLSAKCIKNMSPESKKRAARVLFGCIAELFGSGEFPEFLKDLSSPSFSGVSMEHGQPFNGKMNGSVSGGPVLPSPETSNDGSDGEKSSKGSKENPESALLMPPLAAEESCIFDESTQPLVAKQALDDASSSVSKGADASLIDKFSFDVEKALKEAEDNGVIVKNSTEQDTAVSAAQTSANRGTTNVRQSTSAPVRPIVVRANVPVFKDSTAQAPAAHAAQTSANRGTTNVRQSTSAPGSGVVMVSKAPVAQVSKVKPEPKAVPDESEVIVPKGDAPIQSHAVVPVINISEGLSHGQCGIAAFLGSVCEPRNYQAFDEFCKKYKTMTDFRIAELSTAMLKKRLTACKGVRAISHWCRDSAHMYALIIPPHLNQVNISSVLAGTCAASNVDSGQIKIIICDSNSAYDGNLPPQIDAVMLLGENKLHGLPTGKWYKSTGAVLSVFERPLRYTQPK